MIFLNLVCLTVAIAKRQSVIENEEHLENQGRMAWGVQEGEFHDQGDNVKRYYY
jgi:hypothetical protein